jgi:protein-S-isoprenylcysteine O-methyltransferase Ste14
MQTEELKDKTTDLVGHVGDVVETWSKLLLIKTTRQASRIAATAITTVIAAVFGFFALMFASFAFAWWMGDVVKSRIGGFGIVALFYALLIVVIWATRKKGIIPYFRNLIVRSVYDE